MDWDQEYDLQAARGNDAGPSFSDRARNAVADDERTPQVAVNRARQVSIVQEPPRDTPLEQLTRHWMNERHAPDILPAQEELLASLLDHLRRQVGHLWVFIESTIHSCYIFHYIVRDRTAITWRSLNFRGRSYPDHACTDRDRTGQVYCTILRSNTAFQGLLIFFFLHSVSLSLCVQIEKYARFISTNGDLQTRLTAAERDHAIRSVNICHEFEHARSFLSQAKMTDRHFHMSVLQSLPEAQSHLDDNAIFMPPMSTLSFMVPVTYIYSLPMSVTEPDKTRPVFVHALQRCPRITLPE